MSQQRKHAVVIGGSMAGLLAAQVLSEHFERVTLVERDPLPNLEGARKGVPQGRHLHVLLAAGFASLQRTLPGFRDAALARDAIEVDVGNFGTLYLSGVLMPTLRTGHNSLLISRPAIEGCVRELVLGQRNISLRSGCSVSSLVGDARAITGARLAASPAPESAPVDAAAPAPLEELSADLVVDASGRGTRLPAWLGALGVAAPHEDVVLSKVSYASCTIRRKSAHLRGAHAWVMTPKPPQTHFGAAQAWEDDRYVVTFTTYLGERGPASYAEMLEHAEALPFPGLSELLRDAEPLTDTVQMSDMASRRRRYERLSRFPSGLLVIGDALCNFNPAYGQGMSVAALEAEALASCLQGGHARLAARFFAAASKIVDAPWMLATGADFQWPAVEGRRPLGSALINAYVARVIEAASRDTVVAERLLSVLHLLSAPSSLFSPTMLRRVLWARPGLQLARDAQVAVERG